MGNVRILISMRSGLKVETHVPEERLSKPLATGDFDFTTTFNILPVDKDTDSHIIVNSNHIETIQIDRIDDETKN